MELIHAYIDRILLLMAIHLSAAISPGPSVVLVAHTSALMSRKAGIIAAMAMGVGAWFWAAAALFGMHDLLTGNQTVFEALKLIGAGFLIWTGLKMVRKAKSLTSSYAKIVQSKVFFHALKLQLTNPKVAVFFGAIFLTVFPPEIPMPIKALILAIIFVNETLWYALLAVAFSFPIVQKQFQKWQGAISTSCGLLVFLLGVRLMSENLWFK